MKYTIDLTEVLVLANRGEYRSAVDALEKEHIPKILEYLKNKEYLDELGPEFSDQIEKGLKTDHIQSLEMLSSYYGELRLPDRATALLSSTLDLAIQYGLFKEGFTVWINYLKWRLIYEPDGALISQLGMTRSQIRSTLLKMIPSEYHEYLETPEYSDAIDRLLLDSMVQNKSWKLADMMLRSIRRSRGSKADGHIALDAIENEISLALGDLDRASRKMQERIEFITRSRFINKYVGLALEIAEFFHSTQEYSEADSLLQQLYDDTPPRALSTRLGVSVSMMQNAVQGSLLNRIDSLISRITTLLPDLNPEDQQQGLIAIGMAYYKLEDHSQALKYLKELFELQAMIFRSDPSLDRATISQWIAQRLGAGNVAFRAQDYNTAWNYLKSYRQMSWIHQSEGRQGTISESLLMADIYTNTDNELSHSLRARDAALLCTEQMGDRLLLFLKSRDAAVECFSIPLPQDYIKASRWTDSSWQNPTLILENVQQIHRQLTCHSVWNALAERMTRHSLIYYYPDADWVGLPLALFPHENNYLIDSVAFTTIPSLQYITIHSRLPGNLLAIAVGSARLGTELISFSSHLQPLAETWDTDLLMQISDQDGPITDHTIIEALSESSYTQLHISCHAIEQDPETVPDHLQAIQLTLSEQSWSARDILQSGLISPPSVYLCACLAGRSRLLEYQIAGGLTLAFFLSGAERIISSIGELHALKASTIAQSYYRQLSDGHHSAQAMHHALLDYRRISPQDIEWMKYIHWGAA